MKILRVGISQKILSFLLEKCVPDPTKEVKSVSYRKVSERRGSWPLAYKNVTVQEDY